MKEVDLIIIEIGEKLRNIREEKGFSQKEVAELMGVAQTQYGRLENGKTVPTIATLTKAAKALKVNLEDIIPQKKILKGKGDVKGKSFQDLSILDHLSDKEKDFVLQLLDLIVARLNTTTEKNLVPK